MTDNKNRQRHKYKFQKETDNLTVIVNIRPSEYVEEHLSSCWGLVCVFRRKPKKKIKPTAPAPAACVIAMPLQTPLELLKPNGTLKLERPNLSIEIV